MGTHAASAQSEHASSGGMVSFWETLKQEESHSAKGSSLVFTSFSKYVHHADNFERPMKTVAS